MAIIHPENSQQDKLLQVMNRNKSNLYRQELALKKSMVRRNELIREALRIGIKPSRLARYYGLEPSRIWQIKNELPGG